jgi:hypothetical protein
MTPPTYSLPLSDLDRDAKCPCCTAPMLMLDGNHRSEDE